MSLNECIVEADKLKWFGKSGYSAEYRVKTTSGDAITEPTPFATANILLKR